MPFAAWVRELPMRSNRTGGVTVNLRLEIYKDGHGCLVCTETPDVNQPVADHCEMEEALRRLWDRGLREASRKKIF